MSQIEVLDRSAEQIGFEGMRPAPTPQQEIYCQGIAKGMSRKDAWALAWPNKKFLSGNATRLMQNPVIVARLNSIRADIASLMLWDRFQSVEALKQIVEANRGSPAIVSAVRELNEMHGFNQPVKLEVGAPGAFDVAVRIVDTGNNGASA